MPGWPLADDPDAGAACSQLPPLRVFVCAVQLSDPAPELPIVKN